MSFASDNINFQSKGHIRQLLQDHFKHKNKMSGPKTVHVPQNYTRIPRSRSNTSSTFATSSRDSALGTEVDSDGRTVAKVRHFFEQTFLNISYSFKCVFKCSKIFSNVKKSVQMLKNVLNCSKMFSYIIFEHLKTFLDI